MNYITKKIKVHKMFFIALLMLGGGCCLSQNDTTWVVERVYGINWFHTNQPIIDSLMTSNPNSYEEPHPGATEFIVKFWEKELAVIISGDKLEFDICDFSLTSNAKYFKASVLSCQKGKAIIPNFMYGYLSGNSLVASFCDIDLNIDENLEDVINSNENVHWISFSYR